MRDIPTSPRIIEINHKRHVRRVRLFILSSILLFVVIYTLSFFSGNKYVIIDKIEITGTHIINQDDIEKEIRNDISGKYFYLFAKNNSFIYPEKQIYNNLISKFPRIEKLSINHNNIKTIKINILERVGSFLYCGEFIPENKDEIGENCYFINNDGYIFDKAPYFSGNIYFKYYLKLEGDNFDPLGRQMINVDSFHKISRFIDSVTSIGLKSIYIVMDQDNTNYLYLNHSEGGTIPKIIFKNDDENLEIIQDNLSVAMKKKEFADEIFSKYNTLQYIYLRFKNKVLYKFD